MHFYSTGQKRREQKPKRTGWQFLHRTKTARRKYKQYEETTALRLYNPYKTTKTASHLKIKWAVLPIILISWVGLLLYLPFFKINKTIYTGLKIIKQSEIDEIVQNELNPHQKIWPSNNYFIFNDDSLTQILKNKFSLNSITITKIFPNSLNIQLQEKISAGIYDDGEGYYLLDNEGNNIKYLRQIEADEFTYTTSTASFSTSTSFTTSTVAASSTKMLVGAVHAPDYQRIVNEFGDYPIIFNKGLKKNSDKDHHLIETHTMQGLMAFYNALRSAKTIQANYFIIDRSETGITVVTDKPFSIKFQPTDNIDQQISKLQIFLKNNRPTDYIDLRFGDRIYWK